MPGIAYPLVGHTLDNGLEVVVSPDHTVPTTAVNLWVKVGSRDESPGRTGFAHLFEHLMFQGSRNVAANEHFSALLAVGGRLNATTWFDRTNYFETVPRGALELALWLEADRHGRLLDAVTQENLDNQRDVVKEEKRQRYDNAPYGNALRDIYATVFPEGHPYHHPTIGSMEDLDAASLDDVRAFYARHYGPNNSVLTIVGDVEPEEAIELVEKHFGPLPASATPRQEGLIDPLESLTRPVRCERAELVPNDRIFLAFRLPADTTPGFLGAGLALDALGGFGSSRLVERLVRTEQIATSVSAYPMGLSGGTSLGLLSVDVAAGVEPGRVENEIVEELAGFADTGPTDEELDIALAVTERSWLSNLAAQDERADHVSHYAALYDDPGYVNSFLDRVADISPADVQEAAGSWLHPESRAVVLYCSEEGDRP